MRENSAGWWIESQTDVGDDDNDEEPEQAGDADVLDEAGQVPCPRANAPYSTQDDERQRKGKLSIINQWRADAVGEDELLSTYSQEAPKRSLNGADTTLPTSVPTPFAAELTTDPIEISSDLESKGLFVGWSWMCPGRAHGARRRTPSVLQRGCGGYIHGMNDHKVVVTV